MPGDSVRAFGKRVGVSHVAVLKAIKAGRITRGTDGLIDPTTQVAAWQSNTDPAKQTDAGLARSAATQAARAAAAGVTMPAQPRGPADRQAAPEGGGAAAALMRARAVQATMDARVAELNWKERVGELVAAEDVRASWTQIASNVRVRVLGIPSKVRTAIPHLTPADMAALEAIVRDTLEELASAAGTQKAAAE